MEAEGRFDQVLKVAHELLQIQDLGVLLEHMLSEVRSVVNADAGSIYLVKGTNLEFSYTQNNTLQRKLPFGKKLIYSRSVLRVDSHSIAGYVASTGMVVNIADAYMIEPNLPYSFDKKFDEATGYRTKSMLSVPIQLHGGEVIGVIQMINAMNPSGIVRSFTQTEERIAQLFAGSAALAISRAQMTRSLISCINRMLAIHDRNESIGHADRVGAYAVEIYEMWARKKGIPDREIQHSRDILRMAAMLHNIGKIALSMELLRPWNELTPAERQEWQKHTIYGARIFDHRCSEFEEMAWTIALNHHERWDGSGYPGHIDVQTGQPLPGYMREDGSAFGKSGAEIPIYGRVVALANVYDRLINQAGGYTGVGIANQAIRERAVAAILADSGAAFDPEVVSAFANSLEIINAISSDYGDVDERKEGDVSA